MLERVVVTPRGRVPQLEEPLAKKADGHFSHRSLKEKGSGAPGETRTPGPLLRRQTLYPAELRAHGAIYFIIKGLEPFLEKLQFHVSVQSVQ